jgi:hypothetical protein
MRVHNVHESAGAPRTVEQPEPRSQRLPRGVRPRGGPVSDFDIEWALSRPAAPSSSSGKKLRRTPHSGAKVGASRHRCQQGAVLSTRLPVAQVLHTVPRWMTGSGRATFDGLGLFEAMDAKRLEKGLSWQGVADEIWNLSSALNDRRRDHPTSPSTIKGLPRARDTSCQHGLFYLRWLGRAPEDFLVGGPVRVRAPLPQAGLDRRLRWDLAAFYDALNAKRKTDGLAWSELAVRLGYTPSQIQGIRTLRFAVRMSLALKITQWLETPAANFVYAATW